jgi:hypothetical protein
MKIFKEVVIGIVAAIIATTITYAYFNGQATQSHHRVTTGTLALDVNVKKPYSSSPWIISKMAPGDYTPWKAFEITNTGNLAGWLYISARQTDGSDELYKALYTEIRQDTQNGPLVYNGPLADLNKGPYSLGGKTSTVRVQRIYLPKTDTNQNDLQGKTTEFEMVFELQQY